MKRIFSVSLGALLYSLVAVVPTAFSSEAIREELMTVESRPSLVKKGDYDTHYLLFDVREHKDVHVFLSREEAAQLAELPDDEDYAFRIWFSEKQMSGVNDRRFPFAELASIARKQEVLIDRSECPIHKVEMKRGLAEISYGLPAKEFMDAHQSFSGGPGFIMGGCVVGRDRTTFAYVCSECVAAYQAWREKRG